MKRLRKSIGRVSALGAILLISCLVLGCGGDGSDSCDENNGGNEQNPYLIGNFYKMKGNIKFDFQDVGEGSLPGVGSGLCIIFATELEYGSSCYSIISNAVLSDKNINIYLQGILEHLNVMCLQAFMPAQGMQYLGELEGDYVLNIYSDEDVMDTYQIGVTDYVVTTEVDSSFTIPPAGPYKLNAAGN